MGKTKKPSGLSVTRDGYKFIFSWKIGSDNYGAGQNLQWRRKKYNGDWADWQNKSIGTSATTANVTFTKANYYPNTNNFIKAVQFRVRGKRSPYTKDGKTITPEMSDWVSKSFDLKIPKKPSLTATLTTSNVTTFAWSIATSADDGYLYTKYEWQSIRVAESNETDGSKLTWNSSATGYQSGDGTSTSGSQSITEDTTTISSGSHTRWFRVRSRGVAGSSDWVYAKHVYASPKQADLIENKCSSTAKSYGYLCQVKWKASRTVAYPIDETVVQYTKAIPIEDMKIPTNPSWQDANISADTKGTDTAVFRIDGALADDQCIYVRVNTKHDANIQYGQPYLLRVGKLANPSTPTVSVNNRIATVTVTNNSSAGIYTGNQDYSKLFLHIRYKGAKHYTDGRDIGIIPYGQTSVSVTLPNFTDETAYSFGAKAIVGKYSGVSATETDMESSRIWMTGNVPKAPTNINAEFRKTGDVRVTWDWGWDDADSTEVSWAYSKTAWDSTDQPETFLEVNKGKIVRISNVEVGKTLYVRLRHIADEAYSPYSDKVAVDLTLPPQKPVLSLSSGTITEKGKVTISWNYGSGDGSEQAYAELRSVSGTTIGSELARTTSAQHITLYAQDMGWTGGNSYTMALRVKSASGSYSDYSDSVTVKVKEPIVASVSSTSLVNETVDGRTYKALKEVPLTVTVTGGDYASICQLAIERASSYFLERPNENVFNGYEGETVYYKTQTGAGSFTIDNEDLIGYLDDGAGYNLVATVSDSYGQKDTARQYFEVHWTHQAIKPTATVAYQNGFALISPIAPSGTATGDYCEIYRLSVDKPELIVPNGAFGKTYTDPYPTIGDFGGYRVVFKTKNGDYITSANTFAWTDYEGLYNYDKAIIDFGTDRIDLYYNVDTSHNWSKDFTLTKYLGGSVQGDWNPAVERNSNITAVLLNPLEPEIIEGLSRLAEYPDICHIRMTDGSNFHANVNVNKSSSHDKYGLVTEYSLDITRVDPQGYDGINLDTE